MSERLLAYTNYTFRLQRYTLFVMCAKKLPNKRKIVAFFLLLLSENTISLDFECVSFSLPEMLADL